MQMLPDALFQTVVLWAVPDWTPERRCRRAMQIPEPNTVPF